MGDMYIHIHSYRCIHIETCLYLYIGALHVYIYIYICIRDCACGH